MPIQLVGAIDIGTSYSGWAFSFSHESHNVITQQCGNIEKTRTCVLISPDKQKLVAFGEEAENQFIELTGEEQNSFYYLKEFKNVLKPGQRIHRDVLVKDEMGKEIPAIDVFSMTIEYLAEDLLSTANQMLASAKNNKKERSGVPKVVNKANVLWVITVPAIWTQAARRFMREAAIKAGLESGLVIVALEPEVASIYCQTMSVHDTIDEKLVQFPIGTRYILLDAGGGTVDLSIHEVEDDLKVKEVAIAHGEGWGATMVNEAVENFLIQVVGEALYEEFKTEHIHDWIKIMRDIEDSKKKVHPVKDYKIGINIPHSMRHMFQERNQMSLDKHVQSSRYSKGVTIKETMLYISTEVSRSFFMEPITKILKLIDSQMQSVTKGKPKTIMLVGGFSDSAMIQNAVKGAYPKLCVAVTKYSQCAVLRGAVRYGHHPMSVTERILKYTYGVEVMRHFKPGIHPEDKRVETDKGDHCKQIFSKHVEKQQVVTVGESQVEQRYTPSHNHKTTASLKLFVSSERNPHYTDEPGCSCIGEVTFDLPDHDGDLSRGLWVSYTFSGPEILVDVYDEKSGKTVEAKTWFLGPSLN